MRRPSVSNRTPRSSGGLQGSGPPSEAFPSISSGPAQGCLNARIGVPTLAACDSGARRANARGAVDLRLRVAGLAPGVPLRRAPRRLDRRLRAALLAGLDRPPRRAGRAGAGRHARARDAPDARCFGVAYRIAEADSTRCWRASITASAAATSDTVGSALRTDGVRAHGLVYVATPANPNYLGPAPLDAIAAQVARACGPQRAERRVRAAPRGALRELRPRPTSTSSRSSAAGRRARGRARDRALVARLGRPAPLALGFAAPLLLAEPALDRSPDSAASAAARACGVATARSISASFATRIAGSAAGFVTSTYCFYLEFMPNFGVIGVGVRVASVFLAQRQCNTSKPITETAYCLYEAKRFSEGVLGSDQRRT